MRQRTLWQSCFLGVLTALALSASPASADVRRSGDTIVAFNKTSIGEGVSARYPDVAFDAGHDVYLVVSGQQPIEGRFVNGGGQPLGTSFRVSPSGGVIASRVDFSAAANAFVVTWLDEAGAAPGDDVIVVRLVRYNGNGGPEFLSGEIALGGNGVGKHTESAPSLACATASTECFITWAQSGAGAWNIVGQRFDASNGAPLGPEVSVAATDHWEALPSVAYNSAQNEYFVVHTSEAPNGVMYTVGERIQGGTGVLLGRSTLYGLAGLNNYPEVAYNSRGNLYVVITWYIGGNGADVYGVTANGNGEPFGPQFPVAASPLFEGGDGIGIAYNAYHDGFFAVFQGSSQDTLGVELNGFGAPAAPVFRAMVSGAGRDIFQPQVAAATNAGRYLIATSVDHNRVSTQLMDTSVTGGPPPGGPPPSSPEPSATIDLTSAGAPNGSWFFAEGAAGAGEAGFNTFYLIANENAFAVPVRAYFSRNDGYTKAVNLTVGPQSRLTVNLAQVAGEGSFGAVFQSLTTGAEIFVERSIYWGNNFEGSTSEVAVKDLSHTWYFAEGSCGCEFYSNFFLLYNPTQTATQVTTTFGLDSGQQVRRTYTVNPQSRLTVFANEIPEVHGHNFGTTFVSSSAPIVAERAMYWGPAWIGGTATIGARKPMTQWLFAEGAASADFDTFYLMLNPGQKPARVNVRFAFPDGRTETREYTVPAGARRTVSLNEVFGPVGAVAARFATLEYDTPIIVERSIYWAWSAANGWLEGTNSIGVPAGGAVWHVPEGSTTGAFENFLLIHNAAEWAIDVNITVFTEQGERQTLSRTIPALGRETLYMHTILGELGLNRNQSFATRVATVDGTAWIVVEHAMYWLREGDNYWHAGGSAFGIAR